MVGDSEGDIMAGTDFKNIPDEWTCPQCGEEKEGFIELEFPYAN